MSSEKQHCVDAGVQADVGDGVQHGDGDSPEEGGVVSGGVEDGGGDQEQRVPHQLGQT